MIEARPAILNVYCLPSASLKSSYLSSPGPTTDRRSFHLHSIARLAWNFWGQGTTRTGNLAALAHLRTVHIILKGKLRAPVLRSDFELTTRTHAYARLISSSRTTQDAPRDLRLALYLYSPHQR